MHWFRCGSDPHAARGLCGGPFSLDRFARDEPGQIITRYSARAGPQGRTAKTGGTGRHLHRPQAGLSDPRQRSGPAAHPACRAARLHPTLPLPTTAPPVRRGGPPKRAAQEDTFTGRKPAYLIRGSEAGPRPTLLAGLPGSIQRCLFPTTAPPGGWKGAHGGNLVPSRERTAVVTVRSPPLFASLTRK